MALKLLIVVKDQTGNYFKLTTCIIYLLINTVTLYA